MVLIVLIFIVFTTSLYGDDIVSSANINLWLVIFLLGYKIIKERYLSVSSMFIFGFIYIFFKEFLNDSNMLFSEWGKINVVTGYFVIMFSFVSLQLGYCFRDFNNVRIRPSFNVIQHNYIKNKKKFFRINFLFVYLLFFLNLFLIIEGLTKGRANAFKYGIFSSLSYALAIITIVNFKLYFKQYYGKNNYFKTILYTFPVFILLVASGTRFILLFGVIALVSDNLINLTNKKMLKMGVFVLVFGLLSNLVLELRNVGFLNSDKIGTVKAAVDHLTLNQNIVNKFTNEGMLRNAAMITDYTKNNDYTYGKSTAFFTYWWFPRVLWEEKPTHMDYWLIRKYTGEFEDTGYSTASGFFGELYMDFGKFFIMPFLFLLGYFFSYLNSTLIVESKNLTYSSTLISSAILAWIFFLVRSIMTSSFMIFFIIICAYILNKFLKKWKILN